LSALAEDKEGVLSLSSKKPTPASGPTPFTRAWPCFSRSLLRCADFLLQNRAIWWNAVRISLLLVRSEKHAAQRGEKLRKNSLGNYKSDCSIGLSDGSRLARHGHRPERLFTFRRLARAWFFRWCPAWVL